ncbi:MAG TPA: LysR family transcriptional regulator [Burkholderiaceae bacterium]|nr:LysR family transcriptional regulator [Burkholderiaceae bacterium]
MRFNRLDLNLLVALDAMLTECSITRAAERLHLSQSAMSNALARLRDHFGDELLVQVGRRMELTPRAEALKEPVRDVLVRIDATISAQPLFDPSRSEREFRMFVSDYTMTALVPHLLALVHRQSGTVRFQLLPQVEEPYRSLERGEVDLLVIPKGYCSPDHPTETLFEEEFRCVVWKASPLAEGELTFDRYAAAGHVVMQPPGTSQPSFEAWFTQRYGLSRRVEVTTYSFAAVPYLVVGTDRIATVHARLARQAEKLLPLKVLPPPIPMPRMEQAMQWHKYRTQDPGLLWLRALMKEAAVVMDAEADMATRERAEAASPRRA